MKSKLKKIYSESDENIEHVTQQKSVKAFKIKQTK